MSARPQQVLHGFEGLGIIWTKACAIAWCAHPPQVRSLPNATPVLGNASAHLRGTTPQPTSPFLTSNPTSKQGLVISQLHRRKIETVVVTGCLYSFTAVQNESHQVGHFRELELSCLSILTMVAIIDRTAKIMNKNVGNIDKFILKCLRLVDYIFLKNEGHFWLRTGQTFELPDHAPSFFCVCVLPSVTLSRKWTSCHRVWSCPIRNLHHFKT